MCKGGWQVSHDAIYQALYTRKAGARCAAS